MRKQLLILTLLVLISTFVSAAPPFINTGSVGLAIEHPYISYLKVNESYAFHFHVYNISTSRPVNMSLVTCSFHLYNSTGGHLYKVNNQVKSDDALDYEQIIAKGNFTKTGEYSFLAACNSSNEGGFYENSFYITTTGNELTTSQMLLHLFVGLILLFLFILCVYGGLNIPFANERNQNKEVIAINWKKYLNIFCWAASYMFLISIVFVVYNLIYAYSQWSNLVIFFRYLYRLLMVLILPVIIGIILMTIINLFNDQKINDFIKRMGLPYNG